MMFLPESALSSIEDKTTNRSLIPMKQGNQGVYGFMPQSPASGFPYMSMAGFMKYTFF